MKRCFISFDYDHDESLKHLLIGQSRNEDTPFSVEDWSIKESSSNWQEEARRRISNVDVVIVLCGEHTDKASGVSTELRIAREENVPYFLLKGYSNKNCQFPVAAKAEDKMYTWTWDNLRLLINGNR